MKFRKINRKIKSYLKKNSQRVRSLLMVSKILSIMFLFVFIPIGFKPMERPTFETRIQFNQASPTPLSLSPKTVEVVSAGSREDLQNLEPEAIKGLMKVYAEEYGVDWKLVYAIGYHESGNYTSSLARRQYNFFGRKAGSGGYASWSSPEEAIQNQFEYLKTRYFDQGLNTPQEINRVYAEDSSWFLAIESVINQL